MALAHKKLFVVALVFVEPTDPDEPENARMILLVTKRRPQWQYGKLNGPGGEVKDGETLTEAASRELLEETGLRVTPDKWRFACTITSGQSSVVFVKHEYPKGEFAPVLAPFNPAEAESRGLEFFAWYPAAKLPQPDAETGCGGCVSDLYWLVPFALDARLVPPVIEVRPEAIHNPSAPGRAPVFGGKETDLVKVPMRVKIGGETAYTGDATVHRDAFLPTTVEPHPLADTVPLNELPTPEEVAAMKEAIRAGDFDTQEFRLRDYHESRKSVFPAEPVREPSDRTEPTQPADEPGGSH